MSDTMPDPAALEREIEQTRERLGATIDELLHRTSPKTIVRRQVAHVKAYFVDPVTGQARRDNIAKVAGGVAGGLALVVVVRKLVR